LPTYTRIDAATASIIKLGTFPVTLASSRVQRVGDAMVTAGYLSRRIDARDLIWQPSSTTSSTPSTVGATP
jgi:NitT/TauT family transport system substrate-binding protein